MAGAVREHVGAEPVVGSQQRHGRGRRQKLGTGCGYQAAIAVALIERLPGFGVADDDSDLGAVQPGVAENLVKGLRQAGRRGVGPGRLLLRWLSGPGLRRRPRAGPDGGIFGESLACAWKEMIRHPDPRRKAYGVRIQGQPGRGAEGRRRTEAYS